MAVIHSKALFIIKLPHKQKGVVLIVSLVFLIALTAVSAALMQNTSTDMKMSGASQEKLIASQEILSEMDEIIYNQVRSIGGGNSFNSALPIFPVAPTVNQPDITTSTITLIDPLIPTPPPCPRALSGSSVQVFDCNMLNVQVRRQYGRTNNSVIEANAGIAQQLIGGN
jgi:hypothetical protein